MSFCRESITELLRQRGFDAASAAGGLEALQMIREKKPALVLLDLLMPRIDGLKVLETLRKDPATKDLPVVLLTDDSRREHVQAAARLGVQGYLLKSHFSIDKLFEQIRRSRGGAVAADKPASERAAPAVRPVVQADAPPAAKTVRSPRAASPPPGGAAATAPSTPAVPADEEPAFPVPQALEKNAVLGKIQRELDLQPMPAVLRYVMALTNNTNTSIEEVAKVVRQDQALAVKVLRMANSTFYGTGKRAQSLLEAGQRIGMAGIKNATVAILTMEHFAGAHCPGLNQGRFWEHSLASALLTQLIAERLKLKDAEELFLAGLLHDLGRVILGGQFPEHYQAAMRLAAQRNVELVLAEQELFGLNHAEVTREVLKAWELPQAEAAALHELPLDRLRKGARNATGALVVALANRLAHAAALGNSGNGALLDTQGYAEALGLDDDVVRDVVSQAVDKARDTTLFYTMRGQGEITEPFAGELRKAAGGHRRVVVLAEKAAINPFALLLEQLDWLDDDQPQAAVVHAGSEHALARRLEELAAMDRKLERVLPAVVISPQQPGESAHPALAGRRWFWARMPVRYTHLMQLLARTEKG
jgi:HD-like signal output (HDOD) protein/DNA-binding NarL/FixJ family response regulator